MCPNLLLRTLFLLWQTFTCKNLKQHAKLMQGQLSNLHETYARHYGTPPPGPCQPARGASSVTICLHCGAWFQSKPSASAYPCPVCASSSSFISAAQSPLPADYQQWHDWAIRSTPQWDTLRDVPPPLLTNTLPTLVAWCNNILTDHPNIPKKYYPSVPIISDNYILVIWRDSLQDLKHDLNDSLWSYQGDTLGTYQDQHLQRLPIHSPRSIPTAFIVGRQCPRCAKLLATSCSIYLHPHLIDPHGNLDELCTWCDKPTPITSDMADRAVAVIDDTWILPGVLNLATLWNRPCLPPSGAHSRSLTAAAINNLYLPLQQHYEGLQINKLTQTSQDINHLRVMGINCGGLSDKLAKLIALIVYVDPDVITLQEVGPTYNSHTLEGLPYKSYNSELFPSGGLVTLIHFRCIHGKKHSCKPYRHSLCLTIDLNPQLSLTIINTHFPPAIPHGIRKQHLNDSEAFLKTARAGIKLIQGDFNATLSPFSTGWLPAALRHQWLGFTCRYPLGDPTNITVTNHTHSAREIDWLLVSADTPCVSCIKDLIPGLSTHRTLVCDLVMDGDLIVPRDSTQKQFDFRRATDAQCNEAASMSSLYFWWAAKAGLRPDATLAMYWDALSSFIPSTKPYSIAVDQGVQQLTADTDSSTQVAQWWQQRHNEATSSALRVKLTKLQGVSITSVTAKAIRVRSAKFTPVTEISADGATFATTAPDFKREALAQAKELYSGREGLSMDLSRMTGAIATDNSPSHDDLDFISHMRTHTRPHWLDRTTTIAGGPPTFHELWQYKAHGSPATTLDELVNQIVRRLQGYGIQTLVHMLLVLDQGEDSDLLNIILHLFLVKKEPRWLLENSRPILLEPYLRRLESFIVFKRLQFAMETTHWIPSSMFAYRAQLSPQQASILCRWLIAHWCQLYGSMYIADWDEKNAFCNVITSQLDDINGNHPELNVSDWITRFYGQFKVMINTPYGLAGPYAIKHGGAQGDSMGVGGFTITGIARTRIHHGTLSEGWDPTTLNPSANPYRAFPPNPADPHSFINELSYSDDRRPIALAQEAFVTNLETNIQACWDAAASVNTVKLKTFHIQQLLGRLIYAKGQIDLSIGPQKLETQGLALTGVPLLMGHSPTEALQKTSQRVQKIIFSLYRSHPTYILLLRILLAFAISKLDYVYDSVTPVPDDPALKSIQQQVKKATTLALHLPPAFPNKILHLHPHDTGFGMPSIIPRLSVRNAFTMFNTLNSRNHLVRTVMQHLWFYSDTLSIDTHDVRQLRNTIQQCGIVLHPQRGPNLHSPPIVQIVHRSIPHGSVILLADGASSESAIGWSCIVADKYGILAEASSSIRVHTPDPWAAEWCGKWQALQLAIATLHIQPRTIALAISDNLHATLGPDGGNPSKCYWVDVLRRAWAATFANTNMQEGYMRAQHSSRATTEIALWQQEMDTKAKASLTRAQPNTLPFPTLLASKVHMVIKGNLVVNAAHSATLVYRKLLCPTLLPQPKETGLAWTQALESGRIDQAGLTFAAWLRSTEDTHRADTPSFTCTYCKAPCHSWGQHMSSTCIVTVTAAMIGFHCLSKHLEATGAVITWIDPLTFREARPGQLPPEGLQWRLLRDRDTTRATSPTRPGPTSVTWSGLIIPSHTPTVLPISTQATLSTIYLNGISSWLTLPPDTRWSLCYLTGRHGLNLTPIQEQIVLLATAIRHILDPSWVIIWGPSASLVPAVDPNATNPHARLPGTTTLICLNGALPQDSNHQSILSIQEAPDWSDQSLSPAHRAATSHVLIPPNINISFEHQALPPTLNAALDVWNPPSEVLLSHGQPPPAPPSDSDSDADSELSSDAD